MVVVPLLVSDVMDYCGFAGCRLTLVATKAEQFEDASMVVALLASRAPPDPLRRRAGGSPYMWPHVRHLLGCLVSESASMFFAEVLFLIVFLNVGKFSGKSSFSGVKVLPLLTCVHHDLLFFGAGHGMVHALL